MFHNKTKEVFEVVQENMVRHKLMCITNYVLRPNYEEFIMYYK